jgi:2-keto-4-pentenoate hydratase/2-oxohepta-3-ene-1,7-dioic acid hydratase in catechol pathway
MKLLRYGPPGAERPGLVGPQGEIRDLSGVVADISGETLSDAGLNRLRRLDVAALPVVSSGVGLSGVRLGAPVGFVSKFIGVGVNYAEHAAEMGRAAPAEPVLFSKAVSSIAGPCDDLTLPPGSTKVDHEVELAVIIGRVARRVSEADALDCVVGYCICNDVSERAWQHERGGQWLKGKSADGFGPLGPWLATRDEVPDPQNLSLWLELNGEKVQSSSTAKMIFGVRSLVSYVSQFMTLTPGDVITTGTPPGVGAGRSPQRFLKPGDQLRLSVEGLGEQSQTVRASG